jgi:hypothetical protein
MPAAKATQLDALRKDDVVSRQSVDVRDASALGLPGSGCIVLVEGTDAGVARAAALLKDVGTKLSGADADAAYGRFRSQDDDAATGMGLVFRD